MQRLCWGEVRRTGEGDQDWGGERSPPSEPEKVIIDDATCRAGQARDPSSPRALGTREQAAE